MLVVRAYNKIKETMDDRQQVLMSSHMTFLDEKLEKLKSKLKWIIKSEIVVQKIKEVRTDCLEIRSILDKFKNNYDLIKQKCF